MNNNNYFLTRFNFPAKKLFKRLSNLGATPLLPRGDGDDQHYLGVDGTLNEWLENLWKIILQMRPLPPGTDIISADLLPEPSFTLEFLDQPTDSQSSYDPIDNNNINSSTKNIPLTKFSVIENRRLTSSSHFQDVRHVELQLGADVK